MSISKKMLAIAMMAGLSAADYGKVYSEGPRPTPTPRPEPKTIDQELADKGLHRFEINGKVIIAHNEREAQKRYKKRYK